MLLERLVLDLVASHVHTERVRLGASAPHPTTCQPYPLSDWMRSSKRTTEATKESEHDESVVLSATRRLRSFYASDARRVRRHSGTLARLPGWRRGSFRNTGPVDRPHPGGVREAIYRFVRTRCVATIAWRRNLVAGHSGLESVGTLSAQE